MIRRFLFAGFALIRRRRANCLQFSFPTRGKASVGDPYNKDVTLGFGGSRYAYLTPLIEVF